MANAIWAVPIGQERAWQPFISGGLGALTLRASVNDAMENEFSSNDARFGGNIGAGVMGFSGRWGFKADVRYFRAGGTHDSTLTAADAATSPESGGIAYDSAGNIISVGTTSPTTTVTPTDSTAPTTLAAAALKRLHFWRANVGVALRW
jgi:hypothetical protein